jgi:hypothetical protein
VSWELGAWNLEFYGFRKPLGETGLESALTVHASIPPLICNLPKDVILLTLFNQWPALPIHG